jgi:hypothetical protein
LGLLYTCIVVLFIPRAVAEEKCGKAHSFEVATPEHTFYMFADDEAAKDEWIGAIGKAIVRYSRSYRPEDDADDDSSSDDDRD